MRHERHRLADLPGELRIRGVAVQSTLIDALVDRDAAEETEGDEKGPIRDGFEPHALAIGGDIFGFGRYAVRGAVNAAQAAVSAIGKAPLHALVGKIGEGVTEGRQLPI